MTERQFPWLSDALQGMAAEAKALSLAMSHYNSGSRYNELNGTRLFRSPDRDDGYVNYFRGDHITHCGSLKEIRAFLDGFRAALESRNPLNADAA